jgi:alcohol dehydrogenase class IV
MKYFPKKLFFPQETIFEKGAISSLPEEVKAFGGSGLIVHGQSLLRDDKLKDILRGFSAPARVSTFCRQGGEPTLREVSLVIERAKEAEAQWIVGIGGGSVLDAAKAAAGLFHASHHAEFYQEGGGLVETGIPFIAVPTTAGSGAEATPNAVIINEKKKSKVSIRDNRFLAKKVILDSSLLEGLPSPVLQYAALDAFVQGYESFISRHASLFSEMLALKAIELISTHIVPAYEHQDEESLGLLLLASYFAGVALASSRLGVIHGIAHPLGALYDMPHGLICAVCLVPSIKLNRETIKKKYDVLSSTVGMDFEQKAVSLLNYFSIQSPFRGERFIEKEKIIEETLHSGSTAANPKEITRSDVEFLLSALFCT